MRLSHKQRARKYSEWAFKLRMMNDFFLCRCGEHSLGLNVNDLIDAFERLADGREKDIKKALGLVGRAGHSYAGEEQNDLWEIGLSWLWLAHSHGGLVGESLKLLYKEIVGDADPDPSLRYARDRRKEFLTAGGSSGFNHHYLSQKGQSLDKRLEEIGTGEISLWVADAPLDNTSPHLFPIYQWSQTCPNGYRPARWDWAPPP